MPDFKNETADAHHRCYGGWSLDPLQEMEAVNYTCH